MLPVSSSSAKAAALVTQIGSVVKTAFWGRLVLQSGHDSGCCNSLFRSFSLSQHHCYCDNHHDGEYLHRGHQGPTHHLSRPFPLPRECFERQRA